MLNECLGPLILDVEGLSLQSSDKRILESEVVGGVILFARNFESLPQLRALIAEIRACRPGILVCVDHEGGRVQRFRTGFTRLPSMQTLANLATEQPDIVRETGWLLAAELMAEGVDFSFAPVLDVDTDTCSVIGDRSFSDNPLVVTDMGRELIAGMHDAGMCVTGKHFPGHGSVAEDSHLALPVDSRSLEQIFAKDLIPFVQLLSTLDALMPAHIKFPQVDPQPVGFSSVWLQQILRDQLQYDGVVFSDDLSMKGAADVGGYAHRAKLALDAGCDAILVCNNRDGAQEVVSFLESSANRRLSARLASMRGKPAMDYSKLRDSLRWKTIVEKLQ